MTSRGAIHELFEAQAATQPNAVAVAAAAGSLTYGELEQRSNGLAWHLRELGVGPEVLVGVCMERGPELVVALLGILKAGGAYLPLDPAYPVERLRYMIADARLDLVLVDEHAPEPGAVRSVRLHERDIVPRRDGRPLDEPASASNLAYVIYTSGSTGRPKGVMVSHGSLRNLVGWHRRTYRVGPDDRATQLAATSFDASAWEIWPNLAAGATLYLVPAELRSSPQRLIDWMHERGITLAFLPGLSDAQARLGSERAGPGTGCGLTSSTL